MKQQTIFRQEVLHAISLDTAAQGKVDQRAKEGKPNNPAQPQSQQPSQSPHNNN